MRPIYKIFVVLLLIMTGVMAQSCHNGNEPDEPSGTPDSVTVIYAVNNSSLRDDYKDDLAEMLTAMDNLDASDNKLYVFQTDDANTCAIYEPAKQASKWVWKKVVEYPRTSTSTDPVVLNRVLTDIHNMHPGVNETLIFWGHGSSWSPKFTDHEGKTDADGNPVLRAFGGEYGQGINGKTEHKWMEIDDLVNALPVHYNAIWFDCCYMSAIEVAYQIRNKTDILVAYPTEVWEYGLNYDEILPYLMRKNPQYVEAAKVFFDYYDSKKDPVTATVWDLKKIDLLTAAVRKIVQASPEGFDSNEITSYSRKPESCYFAYYDMVQLLKTGSGATSDNLSQLRHALDDAILYKECSSRDFDKHLWKNPDLCGISMHCFNDNGDKESEYYKSLDFYKAVY